MRRITLALQATVFQIVKRYAQHYDGEVMKKSAFVAGFLAAFVLSCSLAAQAPSLTIQVDHPTAKVSPMLYGLMTEEINYSYDGGIYGELVRDRVIGRGFGSLAHWPMVARGNSMVNVSSDETTGPSETISRSLRVTVSKASAASPAGVENDGYWGIPVRPHTVYSGSFYAKTDNPGLSVTVALQNDQTGVVAATATVAGLTGDWKQFTYTLKTGDVPVSSNNHLILTIAQPATVWFNLVSLFPPTYHDRPDGNRVDIMEAARRHAPQFSAPARRQLSRRRPHCRPLRLEKDHRPLGRPAHAPEPLALSLV